MATLTSSFLARTRDDIYYTNIIKTFNLSSPCSFVRKLKSFQTLCYKGSAL